MSDFLGSSWKNIGGYERTPIGNYTRFPYIVSENINSGGGVAGVSGVGGAGVTTVSVDNSNTSYTMYPVFVSGTGTQLRLLANTGSYQGSSPISFSPGNGDINVVDTLKIGQTTVAIGKQAGNISQQPYAIAIGFNAGNMSQQSYAIAIGTLAGYTGQENNAIAIGNTAGSSGQEPNAISIGSTAGYTGQKENAVAIGNDTGEFYQQRDAVAIGTNAGNINQGVAAVSIGFNAGYKGQQSKAIAIGVDAGYISQGEAAIAIGKNAGYTGQQSNAIAIGNSAGATGQQGNAIAIGNSAGATSQQSNAIAIGNTAGATSQQSNAIAIGNSAGATGQQSNAIAIGNSAGATSQQGNAIAIGNSAGATGQQINAIAIGNSAGATSQQGNAIAIGANAGQTGQGNNSVAIGIVAGNSGQGQNAVAIGNRAGQDGQQESSVAIGISAGQFKQGSYAVAIGFNAGATGQPNNSIVLNAGPTLGVNGIADGFCVNPIRQGTSSNMNDLQILSYDLTTKEILYNSNLTNATTTVDSPIFVPESGGAVPYSRVLVANSNTYFNQISSSLTVECWFKAENTQKQFATLVARIYGSQDTVFHLSLSQQTAGKISMNLLNQSYESFGIVSPSTYNDSKWYHVAVTFNNNILIMYINGSEVRRETSTTFGNIRSAPSSNSNDGFGLGILNLTIGGGDRNEFYTDYNFAGVISDVRIWKVARSATEIASNYQSRLAGTENGLLSYFKLDKVTANYDNSAVTGFNDSVTTSNLVGTARFRNLTNTVGWDSSLVFNSSVRIGASAGKNGQQGGAVAIGANAGKDNQGANAIAIGFNAGATGQPNNSIVLNASAAALNPANSGFFVKPIGQLTTDPLNTYMTYDTSTGEVLYTTGPDVVLWNSGTKTDTNIPTFSALRGNIDLTKYNIQYMIELIWTSGIAIPPHEIGMAFNGTGPPSNGANTVWTNAFTNGTNVGSSAFQSYQRFYCGYQPNVSADTGQTRVILNGVISLAASNLYIMNKFECQSITFNKAGTEVIPGSLANASQQNLVGTAFWASPIGTITSSINNILIQPIISISSANYRIYRIRKS